MVYVSTLVVIAVALAMALMAYLYIRVKMLDEGTADMVEKAGIIRNGANVFLTTEYKIISPVVIVMALVFSLFVEASSGIAILIGALMSTAACLIGMKSATYANVRTANVARTTKDESQAINVAKAGGSVAGLAVGGFGLMGFIAIYLFSGGIKPERLGGGLLLNFPCIVTLSRLTAYSLGCSIVAMFNRVAGGNYTKAADISADTIGKVRYTIAAMKEKFKNLLESEWTEQLKKVVKEGLPEDSFLNPSTLADFIGDCVNDIAGNCSDLLESFVATLSGGMLIAYFACKQAKDLGSLGILSDYVLILGAVGLIASVISVLISTIRKGKDPAKELDLILYVSAGILIVVMLVVSLKMFTPDVMPKVFHFGALSPFYAAMSGIVSGILIGKITEYYTAPIFKFWFINLDNRDKKHMTPVARLAEACKEGAAFGVTRGDAIGEKSTLPTTAMILVALGIANLSCGIFGSAVAAIGMLATVAATVSIDAFGPIADNAGGLAESCHLGDDIRKITDDLDTVGNTTAAIGKGFAIGSAAFATISLMVAFVSNFTDGEPILNVIDYTVCIGAFLGAILVAYFSGMLTDNTIDSASDMADEGDRQLMDGVLAGLKKPDYYRSIELATRGAIRKMTFPSVLAVLAPIVFGLIAGLPAVGGMLFGATIFAVPRAIFMSNSGGAYDNAKKMYEQDMIEGYGKGTDAHVAAVVCDTVGDTRKDSVGVSLDIFIKMMSTVANLIAPILRVI